MRQFLTILSMTSVFAVMPAMLSAQSAPNQPRPLRVGTLQCDVSEGLGLVIGSSRAIACSYRGTRGAVERYTGSIRHVGLDVGATTRGVMIWGVLAPTRPVPFALAGTYVGANAEGSLGLGVGASALVGGSNNSIALQPVSVKAQLGINAAIGVAELTLRPMERPVQTRRETRQRN